jgi:phospholipid-binding lipoprotein MlaA
MIVNLPRICIFALALLCTSCASINPKTNEAYKPSDLKNDPWENINRRIFAFNEVIDSVILKPAALTYQKFMPEPLQKGVDNFYNNIEDAYSIANNILQLKPKETAENTMRFAMNTSFGMLGFIDIASLVGLNRKKEDFGQTLGYWGMPSGPYLILPLLGPSTVRDAAGKSIDIIGTSAVSDQIFSENWKKYTSTSVNLLQTRADLLEVTNAIDKFSLDKYTFMRGAYLQKRKYDVNDGNLADNKNNSDDFPDELEALEQAENNK